MLWIPLVKECLLVEPGRHAFSAIMLTLQKILPLEIRMALTFLALFVILKTRLRAWTPDCERTHLLAVLDLLIEIFFSPAMCFNFCICDAVIFYLKLFSAPSHLLTYTVIQID